MLETIQIPILLKAIDFVFEEGRKILEERRARRKVNAQAPEPESQGSDKTLVPAEPEEANSLKQGLLATKVDELLWQTHEAEIRHLVNLLEINSKKYYLASEQYAKWGSALVPSIVVTNMEEAENNVIETTKRLEILLAKVYKKELQSPE